MDSIARESSKRIRLKICANVNHLPLFSENWYACATAVENCLYQKAHI